MNHPAKATPSSLIDLETGILLLLVLQALSPPSTPGLGRSRMDTVRRMSAPTPTPPVLVYQRLIRLSP